MTFLEPAGTLSPAAEEQRQLWGSDPQGWAQFAEPHNLPLFEAMLDAAGVGSGTRILDVGCGTGLTLQLAQGRGAVVSGIDVSEGLLGVAQERLPGADLRVADMEHLPFADATFDAVVGVNAFQFAGDPRDALREAARVCRPGGVVAVSMFAEPERSEATAIHIALSAVSPPERQASHQPYALSAPGNLEAALGEAGLEHLGAGEVVCHWRYDTVADTVRGLLSSAGGTRAIQDSDRETVAGVVAGAVVPFTDLDTGIVNMRNVFRWVSARRPQT